MLAGRLILTFLLCTSYFTGFGATVSGIVKSANEPVSFTVVGVVGTGIGTTTDASGKFSLQLNPGKYELRFQCVGFLTLQKAITVADQDLHLQIVLEPDGKQLNEVVVSGTMNDVARSDSPVLVDVYNPTFLKRNPAPNLFESVAMINGVRPQMNCNVCNTGDIHINGMEGPYTMILIDGMPIVSSLSTVYGLMGIPTSLIERVEVVKGPASSLYGSEAMGGIINVITRNPMNAPKFGADISSTSWGEVNADFAGSYRIGKRTHGLTGVNYFNYAIPVDANVDGFTDMTLQNRLSAFSRIMFMDTMNRPSSLGVRYVYEDRWGGEMNWNNTFRGGDSIYGESIYTNRVEVISSWQVPVKKDITIQTSYTLHDQNSVYGTTTYIAAQHIGFAQFFHRFSIGRSNWLAGTAWRFNHYDDNTPATEFINNNIVLTRPAITSLPGVFLQNDWMLNERHRLLLGYRMDYHPIHGFIHSPRIAWKYALHERLIMRWSTGTGFRVVNLFTEDHAALTGSREVIIRNSLNPEESINLTGNLTWREYQSSWFGGVELTAFYTYFANKIIADYDTDPDAIIYDNLQGYAVSSGISMNADVTFTTGTKFTFGASYMDVYRMVRDSLNRYEKNVQVFAPRWSAAGTLSHTLKKRTQVDVTFNTYGPMRLPVVPNDFRPEYSPWYTLLNLQVRQPFKEQWELYVGIKNLLNFIPQYPILRPQDPFDLQVNDPVNNPNGYTFDASYNYAPLQGIRVFAGVRCQIGRNK
jgi:outer membrane receptor for ferrienterochelin and colicins